MVKDTKWDFGTFRHKIFAAFELCDLLSVAFENLNECSDTSYGDSNREFECI